MSTGARRFYMLMGGGEALPFELLGDFPSPVTIGVPYDETIDLSGSYTPPVVVDAVEGAAAVPPGLTLEIDGTGTKARLHGTPVASVAILGGLPTALVGVPYSERLRVINAVGAVTIDIIDGDIPDWMSITWHSDTQEIEFHGDPT